MGFISPTLIQTTPLFPELRRPVPHSYPTPLAKRKANGQSKSNLKFRARRDWARELEELSEEEAQLDDLTNEVQHRGHNFLIPIGRTLTQLEEKSDAQGDGESSADDDPDNEGNEEGENAEAVVTELEPGITAGEGVDLDAEMEDLDAEDEEEDEEDEEDLEDEENLYEDDNY